MNWTLSNRFDRAALPLADRHYNRRKIGSHQFVPPGRCLVLLSDDRRALWVTSWPFAEYVRHAWPGAMVNSLFRNEGCYRASDLIRSAIAATRSVWSIPDEGIVTFVDPRHVKPTIRRGKEIFGYCYLMAGFSHVGFTKGGLWAWKMDRENAPMPEQIGILGCGT